MKGETARVARLVRAFQLLDDAEAVDGKKVLPWRKDALQRRIAAVLPQLSREETEAYYTAVRRLRVLK
jgi:hypothetical protein